MNTDDIGIILLAAGGSSRFGGIKQLARIEGASLVKHVGVTAIISDLPTLAVLGFESDKVERELADLALETVFNDRWEDGISTSIKAGLVRFRELRPGLRAVIIMLADQPSVSTYTILKLAKKFEQSGMSIVACRFADTVGPPALFGVEMFDELMGLEGDEGAKRLVRKYEGSLAALIDAPEAAFDVNTPEDLASLGEAGRTGQP